MRPREPRIPPFVTADWLRTRLDDVVVVDARWALDGSHTREGYLEAHLPGAVFVDVPAVCAGAPGEGQRPLPRAEQFAADLGRVGIGDDDTVVVYDQGAASGPARLVWLLRSIGTDAAVLDGGLRAWDGATETGEVRRAPVRRTPVQWPSSAFVEAGELAAVVARGSSFVVDARPHARYTGEGEEQAPRAGHVPTAVNLPLADHLEGGQLRQPDALRDEYDALGAFEADEVVAYCGSGMAACQNLLVLESLGVTGRLYTGSWSQWSADEGLPATTGDTPGSWPGQA